VIFDCIVRPVPATERVIPEGHPSPFHAGIDSRIRRWRGGGCEEPRTISYQGNMNVSEEEVKVDIKKRGHPSKTS